MHTLGDDKGALAILERLVAETAGKNAAAHDLQHYTLLAESAKAAGRDDLAEECAARGVGSAVRRKTSATCSKPRASDPASG